MEELLKQIIKFYATLYKALVITGAIVAIAMLITMIMHRCATVNIKQQTNVQNTEIPKNDTTNQQ